MKKAITEEMHLEKEWFKEAGKMTIEKLPDFYKKIIKEYEHDYGTACHAVAAIALGAAWAACGDEDIGLSGFQAGFVMWDFIRNWIKTGNKCGLRLIDYDDMLYPQYNDKFEKVISADTWAAIQKKAQEKLENGAACPEVMDHWRKITEGIVPFGYRVVDDIY